MARAPFATVLQQLRRLVAPARADGLTDAELLARFDRTRDAEAFATLMQRHGPLVWGACRRALGDGPDTDDAFQATFLVLVSKAGTFTGRGSVASWLYTIAYRLALKVRRGRGRRQVHERQVAMTPTACSEINREAIDLGPALDEELQRLPSRYRDPLVLCYLQGRTNEEAAVDLGCPAGTLKTRLARGRILLRERLARRGLALAEAALATILIEQATAAPPLPLAEATLRAALEFASNETIGPGASTASLTLAQEMLKTMFVHRLKVVAAVLLLLTLTGAGAGAWLQFPGTEQEQPAVPGPVVEIAAPAEPAAELPGPRLPLPAGAVGRIVTVRLRPSGEVSHLAFSGDGRHVLSINDRGILQVWDGSFGFEIRRFPPLHPLTSHQPSLTQDGRLVLQVNKPGFVGQLWDPAQGTDRPAGSGIMSGAHRTVLSPDGKLLARGMDHGIVVQSVVRTPEGTFLKDSMPWVHFDRLGQVSELCFSPCGKYLAANSGNEKVYVWNTATGREQMQAILQGRAMQLAFSGDGPTLLTADGVKYRSWDVVTGKEKDEDPAQPKAQTRGYTPDGRTQIVWNPDAGVELRDLRTGRVRRIVGDANLGNGRKFALSPDGRSLAMATTSGIRVWEIATGKQRSPEPSAPDPLTVVAFSPDGKLAASTNTDDVIVSLWDVKSGRELRRLKGPGTLPISALAFTSDGQVLAGGVHAVLTTSGLQGLVQAAAKRRPDNGQPPQEEGMIHLWRVADGKHLSSLGKVPAWPDAVKAEAALDPLIARAKEDAGGERSWRTCRFLAFAPNGTSILARWEEGGTYVVAGPEQRHPPIYRSGTARSMEQSIWDIATGKEAKRGRMLEQELREAAVARNDLRGFATQTPPLNPMACASGALLLSADASWFQVTDLAQGKLVSRCKNAGENFVALALANDGRTAVGFSSNGQLCEWNLENGKVTERLRLKPGPDWKAALSPDGRLLAVSSDDDGKFQLLDVATGKELHRWPGVGVSVQSLAFSADGRRLVTTTATNILFWEVPESAKRQR